MKRPHPWIFSGFAFLSLFLCIVSAGVFIRSEFVSEGYIKIHYDWTAKQYDAVIAGWYKGRLVFIESITPFPSGWGKLFAEYPQTKPGDFAGYHGFEGSSTDPLANDWLWFSLKKSESGFIIPTLLIFFSSLILPAVWTRRFLRNRRARQFGLCERCGYDLRATPERCPECGRKTLLTADSADNTDKSKGI